MSRWQDILDIRPPKSLPPRTPKVAIQMPVCDSSELERPPLAFQSRLWGFAPIGLVAIVSMLLGVSVSLMTDRESSHPAMQAQLTSTVADSNSGDYTIVEPTKPARVFVVSAPLSRSTRIDSRVSPNIDNGTNLVLPSQTDEVSAAAAASVAETTRDETNVDVFAPTRRELKQDSAAHLATLPEIGLEHDASDGAVCELANGACADPRMLGTAIRWATTPQEAAQIAKQQKKLVFLIQVSGNFAREEFT